MKKCSYILLSVLLSVMLLFMGSGVTFMRCAHTGTVKMMTALSGDNLGGMADMDCSMTSKCMSVTHVELSPTVAAQTWITISMSSSRYWPCCQALSQHGWCLPRTRLSNGSFPWCGKARHATT